MFDSPVEKGTVQNPVPAIYCAVLRYQRTVPSFGQLMASELEPPRYRWKATHRWARAREKHKLIRSKVKTRTPPAAPSRRWLVFSWPELIWRAGLASPFLESSSSSSSSCVRVHRLLRAVEYFFFFLLFLQQVPWPPLCSGRSVSLGMFLAR